MVGAFAAAVFGAVASAYLLPAPRIPPHNPPGFAAALWPLPGCLLALLALYGYGTFKERARDAGPA